MFIVTRIWISISDLDLNSIIESHNENLKNLVNFIIIIKMANGMGSFAFFGFISRPWHFWAHINYHCDPFDTRTPNFYFLGWFSDLFFWPKKRCAFWLKNCTASRHFLSQNGVSVVSDLCSLHLPLFCIKNILRDGGQHEPKKSSGLQRARNQHHREQWSRRPHLQWHHVFCIY